MLLRHSFSYLLARGLPGIINLLAISLYTRLYAPQSYGQYALIMAGAGLGNVILFQWLRLGLLRFLAAWQEQKEIFLSTVLAGFVGLAILAGGLGLIVISFLTDPVLRGLIVLGVLLLWVEAFFELNQELARTQFSPRRYGFLAMTKAVVALVVVGCLGYLGWGAAGLVLGIMSGFLVPVVLVFRRNWGGARWDLVDRRIFRQLLTYGLPLTATFALGFVVAAFDRFFLGWMRDAAEAGLYAVGYDLAKQSIGMLMMTVNLAAYPLAVRALETQGVDAAQGQLRQNMTLLLTIALPSSAGMALLAPNISLVFLGPAFRSTAAELIPWIALAALLAGTKSYYLDLSFQLGRATVGQIWVALGAAVVNLILNFWLIPRHGALGAAWATLAAYATAFLLSWQLGRRIFPLPMPGREAGKLALATAGMALVLLPLRHLEGAPFLLLQVAAGGLVFGLLLVAFDILGARGRLALLARTEGGLRP
jgi:O-antigen/teichoic acid export membrane protein